MDQPSAFSLSLTWCLEQLQAEQLGQFKELLTQKSEESGLAQTPWNETSGASRGELALLLEKCYPSHQAWELTMSVLEQLGRRDVCMEVEEELKRASVGELAVLLAGASVGELAVLLAGASVGELAVLLAGASVGELAVLLAGRSETHKAQMREKLELIWTEETRVPVPDWQYMSTVENEFNALLTAVGRFPGPCTVVVSGPEGVGKTIFLRRAMLEWAKGTIWSNTFTHVFFIHVFELNGLEETSLEELLLGDWPPEAGALQDVFLRPSRVLLILDGFERLKFDLKLRTDARGDWRRRWPPAVLLSSLLQKTMLPECSLLLGFGKQSMARHGSLLQHPSQLQMLPLIDIHRKNYFYHFFEDRRQRSQALEFVESLRPLWVSCESPLTTWLVCTALKWQMDRGKRLEFYPQSSTYLYSSFLTSALRTAEAGRVPPNAKRARLKGLCALAAEGMWTQTYVYSRGDMMRHGVSEEDVAMWLNLKFLRPRGERFMFNNNSLQGYCAALSYFLRQPRDPPVGNIGTVAHLVATSMGREHTNLCDTGMFLFNLSVRNILGFLESRLGFQLSKAIREDILETLQCLSKTAAQDINYEVLFLALFESQDEQFVLRAMAFFEDLFLNIQSADHMVIASFCLKYCCNLKMMHLCVNKVFPYQDQAFSEAETIQYWKEFCSAFQRKKFQVLKLDNSTLDHVSLSILLKAVAQPTCRLNSLSCNFVKNFGLGLEFCKAVLHSSHLRYLSLYGTSLCQPAVSFLCEALRAPSCKVEVLMYLLLLDFTLDAARKLTRCAGIESLSCRLGKCDIQSQAGKDLGSLLDYNTTLKCLSLMENALNNEGVIALCRNLGRRQCALQRLILNFCCVTTESCNHIAQALVYTTTLRILDLGSNMLGDGGVAILCEALKQSSCKLQELWLTSCYLTQACCHHLAPVLTNSENLKTLKLGNNSIQDEGVKVLCKALRQPSCRLQRLGLEMCQLTGACLEDLAVVFATCKTLHMLNLSLITLQREEVKALCTALAHPKCVLRMLGLDRGVYDEESQLVLSQMKARVPHLAIVQELWLEEEHQIQGVVPQGALLT
ncbi:NACHT, LRR and PYD domains-containing protein 9-like [Ochotona curzoniae]|uniref:NACHT, LRR and PYD domains-containing protein 9-like n=1 Tax=Ochotona curzoniae TaxID=130825 RepID=UPI001B350BAB|nr:NACHT, LRR and PYD domains-containing protein 9-like [Ochotona curzoniae]